MYMVHFKGLTVGSILCACMCVCVCVCMCGVVWCAGGAEGEGKGDVEDEGRD